MLQDHIKDILSLLCRQPEHLASNASHHIFKLPDHQEAAVAFDLFNSLGFEVKLYDEEDSSARLYIGKPAFDKKTLEDKLRAAEAYATALANIQQSMRDFCAVSGDLVENFSVNLLNNPDNSKRISIGIYPKKEAGNTTEIINEGPSPVTPAAAPATPAPRKGKPEKDSLVKIGSSLAKTHLMEAGPNKGKEKGAFGRWLYTNMLRHFIGSTAEIMVLVFFLLLISALFVTSKAFLCPDFAMENKKPSWYCDRDQIRSRLKNEEPKIELPTPGGR